MKASPEAPAPRKNTEHQLPRDLQRERGNETTQGMHGRESGPLGSPFLFLCLNKNVGEKGSLHLFLTILLTLLSSPAHSRALSFFFQRA